MPANLTPDFLKAREKFRQSKSPDGKLAALEEMLQTIPKHKGTDHMQADIKRRIAKLRGSAGQSKRGKSHSYEHIPREGAGQVVLAGPPNVGKSTLLAALTNAKPDVAPYPFSSLIPVPGMMAYEDIAIQLVDLPPLAPEVTEAWVYGLIRACDLVLLVLDASDGELVCDEHDELIQLLEEHGIRPTLRRPAGGDDRIKDVAARVVLTKSELASPEDLAEIARQLEWPAYPVSGVRGEGLDALKRAVFEALEIVRVYTKLPGQKPDLTEPYSLPAGSQAIDAVRAVHREFAERLKYVRIWGSGRFDGQQVPSDHVLSDGDIVEIHLRKLAGSP